MKIPSLTESEHDWRITIDHLSVEEKVLVKKKCEFILNEILAKNRSISVETKRLNEFKTDKLREKFDIRKISQKELRSYQKTQLRQIAEILKSV